MLLMTELRLAEDSGKTRTTAMSPNTTHLLQVFEEEWEDAESEENGEAGKEPDTYSILSDDSFYPPDLQSINSEAEIAKNGPLSLYQACAINNAIGLKELMCQELSEQVVMEKDRNGRTGLMVACYQGFMDIVFLLAGCPHLDVNWQDKEGNTALIIATQAGHITITNCLLSYFPGIDIERRNAHGFTALMKAGMQGKTDCVRALMLAGADMNATDPGRGFTPQQWAQFTGRYETICLMRKLLARPCPVQFSDRYKPEWPKLKELVAKANEPKNCLAKLCEAITSTLTINFPRDPQEDGPLDHMVRMTTAISSPFVATGCRTVCPSSPPCVGKRRFTVQEILRKQKSRDMKASAKEYIKHQKLFQNSHLVIVPKKKERRASLPPLTSPSKRVTASSSRRGSLMPLSMMKWSSVQPGIVVPKVRLFKAPTPTYEPERIRRKSSATGGSNFLELPQWKYKELKEERKKAEEEEKRRAEEAERERAVKRKESHKVNRISSNRK
ncbi:ankyrin repeat domain-containing protein 33B-like isoform X1 [Chiloscyllium plagiosum]|uniref:ankyrin repeat domain-containing protein 33B-like isoform X1 n=1 Tax=Chiloscyllium plagiosum TaxID=36176 RepID=UPI001CB80502|nr:ankyrin repeat domain-containing protein 33B-like isoform X1 [Chiloscyllium plagiosum]